MNRSAATEREQRETARVAPALARDGPHRADHVRVGHQVNAVGRLCQADSQWLRHALAQGPSGRLGVQPQLTTYQVLRIQIAQRQIGIADGRLDPAATVANWTGLGAGRARPDLKRATPIDPGNTAATRS